MPKVQRIKNSLTTTLPAQLCRIKGISKGTELLFSIDQRSGALTAEVVRPTQ